MIERLLIVGLGSIGSRHARLLRSLMPKAQIIALRHREHADETPPNVDRCVVSIDEALGYGPQAAVIANPATRHLEVALPLASAGVHLLIEKPIAGAVGGVPELIETCEASGVTLMVGYNLRFSPSLQEFRKNLNAIGRVLSVRAEVGQSLESWRQDADYRKSVSASAELGGGVLLELSHEIDYLVWMFGEVDWVSAVQRKQSRLEIDVEDTAHMIIGFAPKPDGTALVGTLDMDFVRQDSTRTCTVIGETGSLRWDGIAGSVSFFDKNEGAWRVVFSHRPERDETYIAEWVHFFECVDSGRRPMVSGYDGLAVLEIVEAARRSSSAGAVEAVVPIARMQHPASNTGTIA